MPPVFLPVEDLIVEGYANVLNENMRPSVVPPIFSLRSDPARLFVPPYSFHAGFLFNATEIDRPELQDLLDRREVTLLNSPLEAKREFELWVDEQGQIRYESWGKTRVLLTEIAQRHCAEAKHQFAQGNWEEADRLAGIAFAADDRQTTPLVIKAAVRRMQGRSIALMAELAARSVSPDLFEKMVDAYCPAERSEQNPTPARKMPASDSHSPMFRMACAR